MENNLDEHQADPSGEIRSCETCGMIMKDELDFGTESDGQKNFDYCIHCYHDGVLVAEKDKD